jgi:hypothetical protein
VNEWMHELMLVVSTFSSVLAGVTAIAGEIRVRRRDRVGSNAAASSDMPRGGHTPEAAFLESRPDAIWLEPGGRA